jgi:hypothetical protein
MKRTIDNKTVYVSVISHKRSDNVKRMTELCGKATWYVGAGEAAEYKKAGAKRVVESGKLCRSRNAAMDDGFEECDYVVELSDDLKRLSLAKNKKDQEPLTFDGAVTSMMNQSKRTGARLMGCAPTANLFYFDPKKKVTTNAFIVGDFIAIKKTKLRFDEDMRLKEDYDYTLQHINQFGAVARLNDIMATFLHRTNTGGACDYRTSKLEQEAISQLKTKWPGLVRDNPRRPDEILLAVR